MALATAPALAASWLGYGQNPGFYEQDPPLSAFPAFAAAVGDEALNGASARTETIRRALGAGTEKFSATAKEDAPLCTRKVFFSSTHSRTVTAKKHFAKPSGICWIPGATQVSILTI